MNNIGKKLREAREYLELTQEQVASLMGMTRNMIVNIENNNRKVSSEELLKFSTIYGLTMEEIVSEDKKINENNMLFARGFESLSEKDQKEILNLINFKNNYRG